MNGKSAKLYQRALDIIPGGVNSPVRAFKSVKMEPLYIQRGKGSKIYDVESGTTKDTGASAGSASISGSAAAAGHGPSP